MANTNVISKIKDSEGSLHEINAKQLGGYNASEYVRKGESASMTGSVDIADLQAGTLVVTGDATFNNQINGDAKTVSGGHTVLTNVPSGAVFTDYQATKAGHYTPADKDSTTNGSSDTAADITGSTKAVSVITQIQLDSKKHVTGISTAKIYSTDTNTNTDRTSITVGSTAVTGNNTTGVTLVAGTNVTLTPDATNKKITIAATDTNTWRPIGTGASDAAAGNHNHDGTYLKSESALTVTPSGTGNGVASITNTGHEITYTLASFATPHTHPYAASNHGHGNIANDGTISASVAIAANDRLVIRDNSDSGKITTTTVSFDGSTTTKALTPKGTWETFLQSHQSLSNYYNKTEVDNLVSGGAVQYLGGVTTAAAVVANNKANFGDFWRATASFTLNNATVHIGDIVMLDSSAANAYATAANWKILHTEADTNTNYYHTRVYDSGLKVTTGTGVNDLYVPIATSTALGVVKSTTTGTTSGRDYNVEIKSDGTMKVNVPWTDNYTNYLKVNCSTTEVVNYQQNADKTLTFVAGTGITLTPDATNGKITIGNSVSNTDQKTSSGDTSSKIYLVGATAQNAAGQTTYSDNEVYAQNGLLGAGSVKIKEAATIQYNSTSGCLEIIV